MRGTTRAAVIAGLSVAALVAGCGGNSGSSSSSSGSASGSSAGGSGGTLTFDGCTPQNPFIPANTNETCGGDILDLITAKLVRYNPDTAAPEMDLAEKIETKDNQNFTVTLAKGRKFSDGTEVKAKNFVDAWNWDRYGPNGQLNSYFFDIIDGASALDCGDEKCTKKPATDKMSGLKVVDDYTFTIKTADKVSNLPVRLGYTAYAPLPDSFFKDNGKSFGEKPIGAGPYTLDAWDKTTGITLKKNTGYTGPIKANADTIVAKFYQNADSAYADLQANNIDVQRVLPISALNGNKYQTDLPDRTVSKETGTTGYISFPPSKTDPSYDNLDLRHALSMAIDRKTLIDKIFAGQRTPATGWVSPVVDGYKAGACGDYCTYDPKKAKELFTKAGGYNGTITLSYNVNGDHKGWTEAVCNMWKTTLGVNCQAVGITEFSEFRSKITSHTMKGLFRTGWQMDYPSIENFLAPLYATGAGSNDSLFSDPKFDQALKDAAAAPDAAAANAKYQEAESMLKEPMPVIPMWYGKVTSGWSEKVDNVKLTPFGTVDLASVVVKS